SALSVTALLQKRPRWTRAHVAKPRPAAATSTPAQAAHALGGRRERSSEPSQPGWRKSRRAPPQISTPWVRRAVVDWRTTVFAVPWADSHQLMSQKAQRALRRPNGLIIVRPIPPERPTSDATCPHTQLRGREAGVPREPGPTTTRRRSFEIPSGAVLV